MGQFAYVIGNYYCQVEVTAYLFPLKHISLICKSSCK